MKFAIATIAFFAGMLTMFIWGPTSNSDVSTTYLPEANPQVVAGTSQLQCAPDVPPPRTESEIVQSPIRVEIPPEDELILEGRTWKEHALDLMEEVAELEDRRFQLAEKVMELTKETPSGTLAELLQVDQATVKDWMWEGEIIRGESGIKAALQQHMTAQDIKAVWDEERAFHQRWNEVRAENT